MVENVAHITSSAVQGLVVQSPIKPNPRLILLNVWSYSRISTKQALDNQAQSHLSFAGNNFQKEGDTNLKTPNLGWNVPLNLNLRGREYSPYYLVDVCCWLLQTLITLFLNSIWLSFYTLS